MRRTLLILVASSAAACTTPEAVTGPDSTQWDEYEPGPDDPVPHADDPAPEEDDEQGGGSSSGFVPTGDVGEKIPSCDPWDLDSCGEGQKCTGYSPSGYGVWDDTRCVPIVDEPKAIGDPCSYDGPFEDGFDDCEKGAVCWDVMLLQGEEVGTCVPICVADGYDYHCADDENYICNLTKASIGLCLPRCSPLDDDCPVGCSCLSDPGGTGFLCVPNASGGMGEYGVECQYVNSCNPGLFCANADFVPGCEGAQGCCSYFCDITDPSTCPDEGTECVPWFEQNAAPEGYENIGGCGIPG